VCFLPRRTSKSGCTRVCVAHSSNHFDRLDEALARPGRFDVTIPFHDATHGQAVSLFRHFYPGSELQIAPEKAAAEINTLALQFADTVFAADMLADGSDLAVSMAALQGYLLKHKKDPRKAVRLAREWIMQLWEVQQARVVKKLERIRAREALAKDAEVGASPIRSTVELNHTLPFHPYPLLLSPSTRLCSTLLHLVIP